MAVFKQTELRGSRGRSCWLWFHS